MLCVDTISYPVKDDENSLSIYENRNDFDDIQEMNDGEDSIENVDRRLSNYEMSTNTGAKKQKIKTIPCRHYFSKNGKPNCCRLGNSCRFSHDISN